MGSQRSPVRIEGRNGQIWEAYCAGETQEAIAQRLGLDQSNVSRAIAQVAASIPPEDRAARQTRHLEVLDRLRAEAMKLVELPPAQAYSNGRPMFDADGKPIMDYGTRLAAMDRADKFLQREARILGLDQPELHALAVVNVEAREVVRRSAAEAQARLNGEDTVTYRITDLPEPE